MASDARAAVRAARRRDLQALADLRLHYLGEIGKAEPRHRLLPDARSRTEQTLPIWLGQEVRLLLVAEAPGVAPAEAADADPDAEADDNEADEAPAAPVVGYAMGLIRTVPPVLRHQRVGEIHEVYVASSARGHGLGAALIDVLTDALVGRGAEVLRASVPMAWQGARERLAASGYAPLQYEFERRLDRS